MFYYWLAWQTNKYEKETSCEGCIYFIELLQNNCNGECKYNIY
jgi:hypothetical protein